MGFRSPLPLRFMCGSTIFISISKSKRAMNGNNQHKTEDERGGKAKKIVTSVI